MKRYWAYMEEPKEALLCITVYLISIAIHFSYFYALSIDGQNQNKSEGIVKGINRLLCVGFNS